MGTDLLPIVRALSCCCAPPQHERQDNKFTEVCGFLLAGNELKVVARTLSESDAIVKTPMFDAKQPAVEFRLSIVQRIGALLVAVCCVAAATALVWVDRRVFRIGPQAYICSVILCLLAIWGLLECTRKLQVDKQGVWQIRFLRGDDLWSWDEFASGRIRFERSLRVFVDRQSPSGRCRRLQLGAYAQADQQQVLDWIELVWQQLQIPLPAEIEIKQFGESVRLEQSGVAVISKGNVRSYHWADVEQLEIVRQHHNRDDFRRLELRFCDWKMVLDRQGNRRNWSDSDAELIARFIGIHVPEEKQFNRATLDPPLTLREAKFREDEAYKRLGVVEKLRVGTWFVLVGIAEFYSFFRDPRILLALLCASLCALLAFLGHRALKQEYEKLLQWKGDLIEKNGDADAGRDRAE